MHSHRKNALLNKEWVKEDITREIRKYFEMNENDAQYTKIYGMHQLKAVFRGKFINIKCIF